MTEDEPNLDGFGIVTFASLLPAMTVWSLTFIAYGRLGDIGGTVPAEPNVISCEGGAATLWCDFTAAIGASLQAVLPLAGCLFFVQLALVRRVPEGLPHLVFGCLVTLVGMICFNIGLVTSLSPIGSKVGELMPSAQEYYGVFGADVVMLSFGFLAGLGATFAEPALNALGDTVETLTHGELKKSRLVAAVALGVAVGIVIGLAKIRYQLPLVWILLAAYVVAFALTILSDEAITCVAWDSAGVTTGPVTVPIVLSLGSSIAESNHVAEGFGILACASFGPIVAVLLVSLLAKRAKQQ